MLNCLSRFYWIRFLYRTRNPISQITGINLDGEYAKGISIYRKETALKCHLER